MNIVFDVVLLTGFGMQISILVGSLRGAGISMWSYHGDNETGCAGYRGRTTILTFLGVRDDFRCQWLPFVFIEKLSKFAAGVLEIIEVYL